MTIRLSNKGKDIMFDLLQGLFDSSSFNEEIPEKVLRKIAELRDKFA